MTYYKREGRPIEKDRLFEQKPLFMIRLYTLDWEISLSARTQFLKGILLS